MEDSAVNKTEHSFSWTSRGDKQTHKLITVGGNSHKGNKERVCWRGRKRTLGAVGRCDLSEEVVFTLRHKG